MNNLTVIAAAYPGKALLTLGEAAKLLGFKTQTAYNLRYKGEFPVPLFYQNKRPMVRVIDLAAYLDRGEPLQEPVEVFDEVHKPRKRGRPTKVEQMQRARLQGLV